MVQQQFGTPICLSHGCGDSSHLGPEQACWEFSSLGEHCPDMAEAIEA